MIHLTITDVREIPGDSGFLIDDGKTSILYDTGFAFTGYRVSDRIQAVLGQRNLDYVFLTHSHYDHALGSAYICKRYPSVKIVASTYAASIFKKSSARALMRDLDRKCAETNGVSDYEDLIDHLRVDIPVEDGDLITCGSMCFRVLQLSGHTKCSIGFYLAENRMLLGTETLGVYFGENTYLPSCLVGYQMTLDSFRKAGQLEIDSILLPHFGLVQGETAKKYLHVSEQVTIETAELIISLLHAGKTSEEVAHHLEICSYSDSIRPTYPIDAFRLNTRIMVEQIRKELMQR